MDWITQMKVYEPILNQMLRGFRQSLQDEANRLRCPILFGIWLIYPEETTNENN